MFLLTIAQGVFDSTMVYFICYLPYGSIKAVLSDG